MTLLSSLSPDQQQGSSKEDPVTVIDQNQNQDEGTSGREYSHNVPSGSSPATSSFQHMEERVYNNSYSHTPNSSSSMDYSNTLVDGVGYGPTLLNYNNNNVNNTSSTQVVYEQERNWAVVGALIALIILLWVILGGMLCYPILRFLQRRMPVSQRRINRRYDTIEGWLITKVVRPHDQGCERIQNMGRTTKLPLPTSEQQLTLQEALDACGSQAAIKADQDAPTPTASGGDVENQTALIKSTLSLSPTSSAVAFMKHTESMTSTAETLLTKDSSHVDDEHDNLQVDDDDYPHHHHDDEHDASHECPICMEAFSVDDVVSWSSYETCSHVYHHQCIKEWLLRHNNCPFCREIFLPVDKYHKKITLKVFKELSQLRARRAERTYFCIQDGLVTLQELPAASSLDTTKGKAKAAPDAAAISSKSTTTTSTNPTTMSGTSVVTTLSPLILRKCGHIKGGDRHTSFGESSRGAYQYQLFKDKLKPGITKADLKKLRGGRLEKICHGAAATTMEVLENQDEILQQDNNNVASGENVVVESQSSPPNGDNDSSEALPTGGEAPKATTGDGMEDDSETSHSDSIYTEPGQVEVDLEKGVVSEAAVNDSSNDSRTSTMKTAPEQDDVDSDSCRVSALSSSLEDDCQNQGAGPAKARDSAILEDLSQIEVDEDASFTSSESESVPVARRSRPKRLISF